MPDQPGHPMLRLLSRFWGLSAWMLELISALSLFLHKYTDFWIAIALLVVNALLGFLQEQRASAAVDALRHRLQVSARVLRDGSWCARPARELVAGDLVRVRAGDFVPADLIVVDGELRVDQSTLTGESRELMKRADDSLYAGSVVRRGEATGNVTTTGARTYFGRTTQLLQSTPRKLHLEEITGRLVKWLFVIVGSLVGLALLLSLVRGLPLLELLPLSLVLLMSAVPVALPVMFTVSAAMGSLALGRRGVLVTHLAAVEDAANMDILCADKTGTLTLNRLAVAGVLPQPGFSENDVVRTAALASNAANQDPIDLGFLRAADERGLLDSAAKLLSFVPFSPDTRRTEASLDVGGRKTRAMKGALRTVAELAGFSRSAMASLEDRANAAAPKGARTLAVARSDGDAPLQLVGIAFLSDPPRPDSPQLIEQLRSLGIQVKMLTGDALPVAREVAGELGLEDILGASELRSAVESGPARAAELAAHCQGFAEVFPEDKLLVVKTLQSSGHVVGMTGDGVNDAPALKQAEVGIAVRGATDVAKGAASIVLTDPGLASIVDLVRIGRSTYQRVLTWIINKVSRTILKAGFVVSAFLLTGKFVISALGMVLLVFMTDFVKIALSTDRVRPSSAPETWNIGPLVRVAVVLGLLMLVECLGLLAIGVRILHLSDAALHTFSFLALLFFALFSIVSIRERRAFWRSQPSGVLLAALLADGLLGAAIGSFGLGELRPLPLGQLGLVICYALGCSLGPNDILKSLLLSRLPQQHGS